MISTEMLGNKGDGRQKKQFRSTQLKSHRLVWVVKLSLVERGARRTQITRWWAMHLHMLSTALVLIGKYENVVFRSDQNQIN